MNKKRRFAEFEAREMDSILLLYQNPDSLQEYKYVVIRHVIDPTLERKKVTKSHSMTAT